MQRTQPKQLGVMVYIYRPISTYQVSSARLESKELTHIKIVVPPKGIKPGSPTFRVGVLLLQHKGNLESINSYLHINTHTKTHIYIHIYIYI